MNFDYSDEQKILKDAARRFLAVHCTVERVRAVLDNPAKSYDEALWKSMGAQGCRSLFQERTHALSGIVCPAARDHASISSRAISTVKALSLSGRCSRSVAIPESTSYRIALNMREVIYLPVTSDYCKLGSAPVN
ncbi:MAG TPA: hypothetical protein VN325_17200 [Steroidobacteraceae bacterium]|nr:hypothetical protein [Steroidobacteraceae bacterium]